MLLVLVVRNMRERISLLDGLQAVLRSLGCDKLRYQFAATNEWFDRAPSSVTDEASSRNLDAVCWVLSGWAIVAKRCAAQAMKKLKLMQS